jgi:hypothetical protein
LGNFAISASDESKYQQALSSITLGDCNCPARPGPECIDHVCTIADELGDAGVTIYDGGASTDASSTCVDIDLSSYDQSCTKTSDCVEITSGDICPDSCLCGGSTINKDGETKYEAAIAGIKTEPCHCAAGPVPQCVHGKCSMPLPP